MDATAMIQPADETPLPPLAPAMDLDARHPFAAQIRDQLDAAYGQIEDAAAGMYHQVADKLDAADLAHHVAIAGIAGSADTRLDDASAKIKKAFVALAKKADTPLSAAEDKLMEAGATIPLHHYARLDALNDPTGEAIMASLLPAPIMVNIHPGDVPADIPMGPPPTVPPPPVTPIPMPTPSPPGVPPVPTIPMSPVPPVPVPPLVPPPVSPPCLSSGTLGPCVWGTNSAVVNTQFYQYAGVHYWETTPWGVNLPGQDPCKFFSPRCEQFPVPPPGVPPVPVPVPVPPVPVPVPPVPVPPAPVPPGPVPVPVPPVPPGCPPTTIQVVCGTPPTCPPVTTTPVDGPPPPTSPPTSPTPPVPPATLQDSIVAQWGMAGDCDRAAYICTQVSGSPSAPGAGVIPPAETGTFGNFVNVVSGIIDVLNPVSAFTDTKIEWDSVRRVVGLGTEFLFPSYLPAPTSAAYYAAHIGTMEWAGRITGAPMDYLSMWAKYQLQYCNPLLIPSQSELNGMYLANEMTLENWQCYTKANGNIVSLAQTSMVAASNKPNASDVVTMYMRGIIKTQDGFHNAMRANGILDPAISDRYLALAQQIPTSGDLVRFMERDSADEAVVAKYQYDFEFKDKFTAKIVEWAKQNGISEEYMKYLWRAHWIIPSNTQLYDMLHRLRPDRPEVDAWYAQYLPPGAQLPAPNAPPKPPVVTPQDVKDALEVNDNAPGWVDSLMAISYRPITNSDARRAYMLGSFDVDELKSSMLDNGYSPMNADTLVNFFRAEKSKTLANQSGVLTIRKLVKLYKDGAISPANFDDGLAPLVPDHTTRLEMLANVQLEMDAEGRQVCIKAIHKQYLFGELSYPEAEGKLLGVGVSGQQVSLIMPRWSCEKENRLKEPRVQMLCQWYTAGFLTNDEYIRRLRNLGYTMGDAYRIAGACWRTEMIRRWKEEIAEQKALIAEWRRQQREDKADYKDAIKAAQDQIKQNEKQIAARKKELKEQSGSQPSTPGEASSPPPPPPRPGQI